MSHHIIWISRHAMTEAQGSALVDQFREHSDTMDPMLSWQHENEITFPAQSQDAVAGIAALAARAAADRPGQTIVVAGVFPAHIAARLVCRQQAFMVALPVMQPAAAKAGEVRGGPTFVHSHWEWI